MNGLTAEGKGGEGGMRGRRVVDVTRILRLLSTSKTLNSVSKTHHYSQQWNGRGSWGWVGKWVDFGVRNSHRRVPHTVADSNRFLGTSLVKKDLKKVVNTENSLGTGLSG